MQARWSRTGRRDLLSWWPTHDGDRVSRIWSRTWFRETKSGVASGQRQRHWLGLPVLPRTEGTLDDILSALPHFGGQPFAISSINGDELGINSYLDMVYRLPIRQSEKPIPVGVVSKNYRTLVESCSVSLQAKYC